MIRPFPYESVRFKVRDGKATADVLMSSLWETKIMMQELDMRKFMGYTLSVGWSKAEIKTELIARKFLKVIWPPEEQVALFIISPTINRHHLFILQYRHMCAKRIFITMLSDCMYTSLRNTLDRNENT